MNTKLNNNGRNNLRSFRRLRLSSVQTAKQISIDSYIGLSTLAHISGAEYQNHTLMCNITSTTGAVMEMMLKMYSPFDINKIQVFSLGKMVSGDNIFSFGVNSTLLGGAVLYDFILDVFVSGDKPSLITVNYADLISQS